MPTTAQAIASLEAQRTALAATYAGYIAELQKGIDSLVANYLRVFPSKTTAQAQAFLAAHDGSYSKCVYGISMYQQQYNTKDQALQAQIAALQRTAVGAGLGDEDTNEKPKPSRLADVIKAKQAANSKAKLADALRLLREAHKEQTALGSKNHEAGSKLTSDTKSKNTEDTVKTLDAELKAWLHSKKTLPPKTKDAVSDGAPTTTWVSAASVGVVLAVCACVSVFAVMRRHRRQSESSEVYVTLA